MSSDFLSFFPDVVSEVLVRLAERFKMLKTFWDNWRLLLILGFVAVEGVSLTTHSATISERLFRLRRHSSFPRLFVFFSLLEAAVVPCLPESAEQFGVDKVVVFSSWIRHFVFICNSIRHYVWVSKPSCARRMWAAQELLGVERCSKCIKLSSFKGPYLLQQHLSSNRASTTRKLVFN